MSDLFDKIKSYSKKFEHKVTDRKEFKIVRDTLVKYGMSTVFFDRNLQDLQITESVFDKNAIEGSYNPRNNSIEVLDNKYSIIRELFRMASRNKENNNELMGILQRDNKGNITGVGFDDGINDYFTHLACPEYETIYPFEERVIAIISETFGIKPFTNHFSANPHGFYSSFGQDQLFIMEISKRLDNYNKSLHQLNDMMRSNDVSAVIKDGNRLVNTIVDNIIGVCTKLFDLLELKGVDSSKYMVEMKQLFEKENNMAQIRTLVESSNYKKTDKVFNMIYQDGIKL